jgi:hypothetical protein
MEISGHQHAIRQLAAEKSELLRQIRADGLGLHGIAKRLGVTKSRVQQLCR